MQNLLDKRWESVMSYLEQSVTSIGFDLWLRNLKPINIENDTLVLVCQNEMFMDSILRSYSAPILEAIKEHFKLEKFRFIMEKDKESYIERHHLLEKSTSNQEDLPKAVTNEEELVNPLIAKYTFDNFVVGTTNGVIYAATRSVAENPGKRFNPLFIYGGVGLGKTHLLHAIGNYIWDTNRGKVKIVYTTSDNFTNEFIDVLRNSKEKGTLEFRKKYRHADVLLIDDIQFFAEKKKVQEEFFNTFNDLFAANKQIIIASDRPPKEIFGIEERLSSRFSQGLVQDIQKPDFETRVMIIKKKIDLEGYNFNQNLIPKLAEYFNSFNIREIEGALNKLNLTARLHGKDEVDEETLHEVAKSGGFGEPIGRVATQEKIINAICIKFNIKQEDLFGRRRTKELAEARQYCIYLMWRKLDLPLTSISKLFNRDHTTAIHARDKILELIKTDPSIKKLVEELEDLAVH